MRYLDPGRDPRSHAGHERRIDWLEKHLGTTGLAWGAASYFGTIPTGSNQVVAYDEFVTTDDTLFSMTDGKLHTLDEGTYLFFSNALVILTLAGTASFTASVTAESFGSIPSAFYWIEPAQVQADATNKFWQMFLIQMRSYSDDVTLFPTDQYLQFTINQPTSNCTVSALAVRISDPLPIAF